MTARDPSQEAASAVSFDLFGTLVSVTKRVSPATEVRRALEDNGIDVPADWSDRYSTRYIDRAPGAEIGLVHHVRAALGAAGRPVQEDAVRQAVIEAFDPAVETCPGAPEAVATLADRAPVAILSNCSVPEIAERAVERSSLDRSTFAAVVTSEGCGWRKPDARAFRAVASAVGVDPAALLHVGDDPVADTGLEQLGGTAVLVDEVPLRRIPAALEDRGWLP